MLTAAILARQRLHRLRKTDERALVRINSSEVGLWDAMHANFHADFSFGWQRYITRVSSVKRSQWNFVDRVVLKYETREEQRPGFLVTNAYQLNGRNSGPT